MNESYFHYCLSRAHYCKDHFHSHLQRKSTPHLIANIFFTTHVIWQFVISQGMWTAWVLLTENIWQVEQGVQFLCKITTLLQDVTRQLEVEITQYQRWCEEFYSTCIFKSFMSNMQNFSLYLMLNQQIRVFTITLICGILASSGLHKDHIMSAQTMKIKQKKLFHFYDSQQK